MHLLIFQFLIEPRIFPVDFNQPESFVLGRVELVLLTFSPQLFTYLHGIQLEPTFFDRRLHRLVRLLICHLHVRGVGTAISVSLLNASLTEAPVMLSQSETLSWQSFLGQLLPPTQVLLNRNQVLQQDLILVINHSTALYNNHDRVIE